MLNKLLTISKGQMPRYWTVLQLCIWSGPGLFEHLRSIHSNIFLPYITSQVETVTREDIVWDRYLTSSLKQSTRDHRRHSGTMQRQRVIAGVPIPVNWEAFLRSNARMNCFAICPSSHKLAKLAER